MDESTRSLVHQIRRTRRARLQAALKAPAGLRKWVRIPGEATPIRLKPLLQPWQIQDFHALDLGWIRLAGRRLENTPLPYYQRAYLERPRGHSKTTDMALRLAWILLAARQPLKGVAAAADLEQAELIQAALLRFVTANPFLRGFRFRQGLIHNELSGSQLQIISSDVAGSWGLLPDFVICDELCHWPKPDLWYSLLSAAAKRPNCVLTVLTNAGVGRGWQWKVREYARQSPEWYFSSLDGPQAPWITPQWLAEQQALLPQPVYERVWLNRWQHSAGEFVTLAEAAACRDDSLTLREFGEPGISYVAAIDYAEKHDYTVGCIVHQCGERVLIDRLDVVVPTADQPTPVLWVEHWMEAMAERFPGIRFVIDPYQLLGVIQRLEHRFPIRRFDFAGGEGNHQLAARLRQLILNQQLAWYPGCGEISRADGVRDDLETELASLLLKQSAAGRIRIDHRRSTEAHDDRAFAVGAACLELGRAVTEPQYFEVSHPAAGQLFDW
jgi:hypothetical protein